MEKPLFRSLSGSTDCLNSIDIFQYARPGQGIYRLAYVNLRSYVMSQ